MKSVLEKIDLYKQSLANVIDRKELWAEVKKPLIQQTLMEIQQSTNLDWSVQVLDDKTTPEAVNIHFHQSASGIIEVTDTRQRHLIKRGGALIFSQGHNGSIYVFCTFPYVEIWVNQQDAKVFEKVDPSLITKDFVIKQVEKFLDEMRNWEDTSSMTRIGFNVT